MAQPYRVPKIYINTNGLLLTGALVEHMVGCDFHAIGISLGAATKATYERIRVGARSERVLDNIRMINRVKRRNASEIPHLNLNFVIMRSNVWELSAFVALAHDLEVPNVNAIPARPSTRSGTEKGIGESVPSI
jgi:MoaA/NifB/PqqE/SkfB family radical SAM enzyme